MSETLDLTKPLFTLRKTDDFKTYLPQVAGSPQFGDISRIVLDDQDLTSTSTFRRAAQSSKKRESSVVVAHHNYSTLHKKDIRLALRQLQGKARENAVNGVVRMRETDLAKVLSTEGYVEDAPSQSLPRALLQSTSAKGARISLGERRGVVKEELGKGTYAKVVLMETITDGNADAVAVKAQAPTDCLGLEFSILKAIEARVGPHCTGPFPFPRALAFISVANGGLLGMTHGSQTGINLVDLVNVYKVIENTSVPELIAFHYTIIMLKIIEALHWRGKILVRM